MLLDKDKKNILFLESKFSEYLIPGPIEFSKTDYYEEKYNELRDTLNQMGIDYKIIPDKDGNKDKVIRLEKLNKDIQIYCEGIKQMISHFMGVETEFRKGSFKGKSVYLGEILFNFEKKVTNSVPEDWRLYVWLNPF